MKEAIEAAIKTYISSKKGVIMIDGGKESFLPDLIVSYLSTITCSPYDEQEEASAWENEYKQWKITGCSSLVGNISFEVKDEKHLLGIKFETTTFFYDFVEDENIKIVIKKMICCKI